MQLIWKECQARVTIIFTESWINVLWSNLDFVSCTFWKSINLLLLPTKLWLNSMIDCTLYCWMAYLKGERLLWIPKRREYSMKPLYYLFQKLITIRNNLYSVISGDVIKGHGIWKKYKDSLLGITDAISNLTGPFFYFIFDLFLCHIPS